MVAKCSTPDTRSHLEKFKAEVDAKAEQDLKQQDKKRRKKKEEEEGEEKKEQERTSTS